MGSTSYLTNKHGNVSQHVEYIPFGETLIESHLNNQNNPYLYNGKELDAETGFYYYGARYYEPKSSLWLSVDPLAEKFLDFSPYAYAFQNPLNFIDPTGMEGEWWPQVKNDGGVQYIAEKNDDFESFSKQYNISLEKAKEIIGTDQKLKKGTIVSGEKVKSVTGKEILPLYLKGRYGGDQYELHQLVFAIKYSQQNNKETFNSADFFSNITGKTDRSFNTTPNTTISGNGVIIINGKSYNLSFFFVLHRGVANEQKYDVHYFSDGVPRNGIDGYRNYIGFGVPNPFYKKEGDNVYDYFLKGNGFKTDPNNVEVFKYLSR